MHRITQPLFPWSKAKGIRISEGSARVWWYETELLIGEPNGGFPKLSKYRRGYERFVDTNIEMENVIATIMIYSKADIRSQDCMERLFQRLAKE